MTVKEALIFGAEILNSQENPAAEAEIMLAFALSQSRLYVKTHGDEVLSEKAETDYKKYINLRKKDYPAAYIIGEREFFGLQLITAPGVLIPRPETEILAEKAINLLKNTDNPVICDMGTGSGAIAAALASCLPDCSIFACDISENALCIAEKNINRYNFSSKIKTVKTDYFSGLSGKKFDAIITNPPYIPTKIIDTLEICVKDYEPYIALDGGADGLDAYRIIFSEGKNYLKPKGFIACEIGYDQGKTVPEIAENNGFEAQVFQDFAGLDRVVIARNKNERN